MALRLTHMPGPSSTYQADADDQEGAGDEGPTTRQQAPTPAGFSTMAQKSVISARAFSPSPTMWQPAGVCCQLLATTIHTALNMDPSHTPSVAMKWTRGLTRFQPEEQHARKPLSPARRRRCPRRPGHCRTRRPRSASTRPSWCRTRTPSRCPWPPRCRGEGEDLGPEAGRSDGTRRCRCAGRSSITTITRPRPMERGG